ncbi:hypothetical protein B0J17DRAFT_630630 [Rhizoctonia solani]|nr:hypothetical protein B0J17DRAFT_630630 [Rhizoctonia solani]
MVGAYMHCLRSFWFSHPKGEVGFKAHLNLTFSAHWLPLHLESLPNLPESVCGVIKASLLSLVIIRHRNAQPVASSLQSPRGTSARFANPCNVAAAIPRVEGSFHAPGANKPTGPHIPQFPSSRAVPLSGTTLTAMPPSADFTPTSNPGLGIGMGMLRMSVDSIIDAYGGASDTGYRYGGSRTGEGGYSNRGIQTEARVPPAHDTLVGVAPCRWMPAHRV